MMALFVVESDQMYKNYGSVISKDLFLVSCDRRERKCGSWILKIALILCIVLRAPMEPCFALWNLKKLLQKEWSFVFYNMEAPLFSCGRQTGQELTVTNKTIFCSVKSEQSFLHEKIILFY